MTAINKPEDTVNIEIDGMEDIFTGHGDQTVAIMARNVSNDNQTVATISEASRLLQIPYTTLRRQVKDGRFKTQTSSDGKTLLILDAQLLSSGGQMVANHFQAATSGGHTTNDSSQADRLLELIERQSKQLQDASCRIGWLESQLQEREKEVKLLTDGQHKPSWWLRLKNLFLVEPKR